MAKYPNQRTIKIDKINSTGYFAMYGNPEIGNACKVLNGSAFKVYCYIFANSNGFELDISPAHAEKFWGIAQSTFQDGINELLDKGFIVNGIAHQRSTKDETEIRKKKRYSDIRENDTKLDVECTENGKSNSKYNNKNSIEEVLDTSVSNFDRPKDEYDWLNSDTFIF